MKPKKKNAPFMTPVQPSEALAKVIGGEPISRPQAVKKLWAYIKENKLQDQKDKRNVIADANLKPVFEGKEIVSMFEISKLLSGHLQKIETAGPPIELTPEEETTEEAPKKDKLPIEAIEALDKDYKGTEEAEPEPEPEDRPPEPTEAEDKPPTPPEPQQEEDIPGPIVTGNKMGLIDKIIYALFGKK